MKSMFTRGKGGSVTGTRVGGKAAQPGVQGKGRKAPLAMALEPRFMFDAAGVATAASDPTADQHADPNAAHPDGKTADAAQKDAAVTAAAASAAAVGAAPTAPTAAPAMAAATSEAGPVDVRPLDPAQNDGKKEVVFIESDVAGYQTFVDGAKAGVEVVLLDASKDGLTQMVQWAQTHQGYDAIHVVSHGSEGVVYLGALQLNADTLAARTSDVASLGKALSPDGDLLLYGCEVASSKGLEFVSALARTSGADVAASNDLTGSSALGGNWTLETKIGDINEGVAFSDVALNGYGSLLVTDAINFTTVAGGAGTATVTVSTTDFGTVAFKLTDSGLSTAYASLSAPGSSTNLGNADPGSGSKGLVINIDNTPGATLPAYFVIATANGTEFRFDSINLYDFNSQGYTVYIVGYRDGVQLQTDTFSDTTIGANATVSLSTNFDNVDQVRIYTSGGPTANPLEMGFDDVVLKSPILGGPSPTVTDGNISIAGHSGASNTYKVGDTVTATWNNTSGGDNNSSITSVTVDFSAFGGGTAVAATNSSDTWTATYVIASGSVDGTSKNVSVKATNGNGSTTTADTTNATVDNIAPVVTGSRITLNNGSGTGSAFKVGDTVTATWNNTGTGDNSSTNNGDLSTVTVDFSQFGGGTAVAATPTSGVYKATYVITGGTVDGGATVSVKATDDAGNTTTTTSNTTVMVDNQAPTVTGGKITLNSGSGTSGAFKVGDTVTATWNNTSATGDNNGDLASVTVDFSQFGGGTAVAASNSSETWTATYVITGGSVDATNRNVSVTVTDDAGNTTTTSDTTNATVDNVAPTITAANTTLTGTGSGTAGGFKIGDTVTATWNNSGSGDSNLDSIASVTVNFSQFGGGAAVAATNSSGTWTATYVIASGTVDGASKGVTITATDNAGNTANASPTTTVTVDNQPPTVTAAKISVSGGTGTSSAYKIGDTVTATWNNTGIGDNNTDGITSVTMDFSQFGGGTVAAANSSGTWTATYVIAAGSVDGTNKNVSVTATDNMGNTTTTAGTGNVAVDNVAPTVTDAKISISGALGTSGAYKIGDTVTATWNNTAGGDNNADGIASVTVDFSAFGGGAAVAATNSSGTWTATYVIAAGSIDATNRNVSVTVTDNAGNTTTTADGTNATVDNIAPTATDAKISIAGATGAGGVYKTGDTVTATWDNTGAGDNNADTISTVTVNFSQFGGGTAVAATNSSGTWTATYVIAAGSINASNKNVTVTVTDNAGNAANAADTTNASVNNVGPTVTAPRISISGASGTSGAYKIGDTVTATWNNTAGGDNNASIGSVTMDFSQFGGGTVAAANSSGTWTATYVITAGSVDGTSKNVSVTATNSVGNPSTTAGTTNATVDNVAPTVTDAKISIGGASGTGGAYKIGDTVTATWNNTAGGDNNTDSITSVTVDFSAFGGGTAVAATESSGTWTATYIIASGSVDGTNKNVSVTATDNAGNTTTTADSTNATVDNVAPTLTDAKISISGASGTGGAYKIGDTVTATWNNTGTGDNNTDSIASVTVNFSQFGGGTAVAATESSGTWTATYVITAGSVDGTNKNVSVTATDNAGNTTTTADGTNATVDNVAPTVTDAKISISGGTGTGGAYKIGDTVTATWDNSISGDNNTDVISTVTVDFSQFGGGTAVTASSNADGVWTSTYIVASGSIDTTSRNVAVTVTDNAGNTTTTADSTNATVDNVAPTVTDAKISIGGASGTSGAYKIGDTVTATWNNTGTGDNNTDSIASVTVDFSAFGGGTAVAATNSSGTWTATYVITAGSIDVTNRNVSVTATDNAGNTTTTADSTNATVDNVAPVLTVGNMAGLSTPTGTGNTLRIGDTVTAVWDNSASGDNNPDTIGAVTADFSQFGGGSAVAMTNSGGVWRQTYVITAGSIDATNRNVAITVTDNAGNTATVTDTANRSVDNVAPTVTDANVSISGGTGTGGAYKIGDTVTATWNNTAAGDNNSDSITSVTVDFSQFGGGTAVTATNSAGTWTATYVITAGSVDGTNKNVSVKATDNAGNTTTTADSTNATVDNVAPTVTDVKINISGASGTGGAYKIGDTVTVTWNNTAGGDNNADSIASVTVNFSQFGGGTAVAATNSAGTWTATYVIASGSIDGTNKNVSVTASDNAGNTTTTADSTSATVDNVAPTVTDAKISIGGASGTGGAYKIGDTVTATWNNTAGGDNNTDSIVAVTMDFSQFGGGTAVTATNSSGTWTATYVITAGSVEATNRNVSVTVTDNAGNTTTTADSTNATVDTVAPIQTIGTIGLSADVGTSSTDFLTATAGQTISATLSAGLATGDILYGSVDGGTTWTDITGKVNGTAVAWTGATLLSGTNSVKMKVVDAAGNEGAVASQSYTLDATMPSVQSIAPINAPTLTAASVTYRVVFSETVANVTTDDFVLTATGSASGTVASVSGSGTTWDITVTGVSGDGTLRLDLKGSTDVIDSAGNGNGTNGSIAAFTTGTVHTADRAGPAFTSTVAPSVPENSTPVVTLAATDSNGPITYQIVGGEDSAKFTLTGTALSFTAAPDYETRTDANADNVYKVVVRATDSLGNTTDQTLSVTVTNVNETPANGVAPVVTGTAAVGQTLTAGTGSWTDPESDVLTHSYQWYRASDSAGTGATAISGATSASYAPTTSDAHQYVRVVVTANDGNGHTPSVNGAWTAIGNSAPVNSAVPAITGTATVGSTLSVGTGSWSDVDADTVTYSYQWYRSSDSAGTGATAISGATGTSYTPALADAHKYLRVVVTANDAHGSTDQTAATVWTAVGNSAPVNTVVPTVSGPGTIASALTATSGSWSDADADTVTYSYQWYRASDSAGTGATAIGGATSSSYTLTGADDAKHLQLVVTATDGQGGSQAAGSAWRLITNSVPVIGGVTTAAQPTTDTATVTPFAAVTIQDADTLQVQTVTVTLDSAARGALAGTQGGSYDAATGVWSFTGTAAQAQTAVRALVFTPAPNHVAPAATETTTFTIAVNDGVAGAVSDGRTTVVTTSVYDTPVIGGLNAGQAIQYGSTAKPFATATVADPDVQTSRVQVIIVNGANQGDFTAASAAGWTRTVSGTDIVYEKSYASTQGIGGAEQADLRNLVFAPTSTSVPNAPASGTTAFQVKIDDGGNWVSSPANAVTVVEAQPNALASGSDSGASGTDRITNATTPTVRVSLPGSPAAAGDTVELLLGGTSLGHPVTRVLTAADVAIGYVDLGVTAAGDLGADGAKTFTARVTDANSTSTLVGGALTVTLDTTPPPAPTSPAVLVSGSDSGRSDSDGVTRVTSPTVRVSLGGTNAVAGDTVELLLGGSSLGHPVTHVLTAADITNGYVDLGVTAGDLGADGAKTFTSRVTDVAGNVGTAGGALTITLDTSVPALPTTIAVAAADDTGTSSGDGITRKLRPAITGMAEANSTVTVNIDGTDVGTATADATGAWSYTPTSDLVVGAHVVKAKATDAAGNAGDYSATATMTIDRSVPTVVSVGAPANGTYKLGDTLQFTVTFSERVSRLNSSTLNLVVDLAGGGTATRQAMLLSNSGTTAVYAYTVQAGDLDGNGIQVSGLTAASAIDTAGNALDTTLNGVGSTAGVMADGVVPLVASVTLPQSQSYRAGQELTFVVTFDDPNLVIGGTNNSALGFTIGGAARSAAFVSQSGGAVTYRYVVQAGDDTGTGITVTGITAGTATYRDTAGNDANLSLGGKVGDSTGIVIDTGVPTVAAPAVTSSTVAGSTATERVSATSTPAISGTTEANSTVTVLVDGKAVGTTVADATGAWKYSFATALADGVRSIQVQATDKAGNASALSTATPLTIDTTAPGAPTVTVGTATSGATAVRGTAEANALVVVTVNGKDVGTARADAAGTWQLVLASDLGTGSFTIAARARDAAGNTGAAGTTAFTVAPPPPPPTTTVVTSSGNTTTAVSSSNSSSSSAVSTSTTQTTTGPTLGTAPTLPSQTSSDAGRVITSSSIGSGGGSGSSSTDAGRSITINAISNQSSSDAGRSITITAIGGSSGTSGTSSSASSVLGSTGGGSSSSGGSSLSSVVSGGGSGGSLGGSGLGSSSLGSSGLGGSGLGSGGLGSTGTGSATGSGTGLGGVSTGTGTGGTGSGGLGTPSTGGLSTGGTGSGTGVGTGTGTGSGTGTGTGTGGLNGSLGTQGSGTQGGGTTSGSTPGATGTGAQGGDRGTTGTQNQSIQNQGQTQGGNRNTIETAPANRGGQNGQTQGNQQQGGQQQGGQNAQPPAGDGQGGDQRNAPSGTEGQGDGQGQPQGQPQGQGQGQPQGQGNRADAGDAPAPKPAFTRQIAQVHGAADARTAALLAALATHTPPGNRAA